jgi:hypothetical protein
VSIPVPSASADARDLRRLPVSTRLGADSNARARSVSWAGSLPSLLEPLRAALSEAWGLSIVHASAAPDPLALPAFAAAFAQARADQVLRAFSRRTNLVLSGSTTAVVGDGPLADALTAALTRIGARVVRVAADPVAGLRAHLAGLEAVDLAGLTHAAATAHYVLATGESHPPLSPADFTGVLADASVSATGLLPAGSDPVRAHVGRAAGSDARVVDVPPPFPPYAADDGTADGLAWRLADLVVALSLLWAETDGDTTAADIRLAQELLA